MLPELWVMPGTGWALKSFGFMMMVGFLTGVYAGMRRCMKVKCDPDAFLNVSFVALISGVIGARIFFVVHYWKESFADTPNPIMAAINVTQGGLEFLGGVVPAIVITSLYMRWKGYSIRFHCDALAITLVWAMGIGRLGCFLNGCCFGGICEDPQHRPASALAVQFPFGSPVLIRQWEQRKITVPAELIYEAFREDGKSPIWEAMPISRELLTMTPEAREKPFREYETLQESYERAKLESPDSDAAKSLASQLEAAKSDRDAHRFNVAPLLAVRQFPSRVDPSRGMTYDELRTLADQCPARYVHPTQLYDAVGGLLLAGLLARVFHRRKRHGVVFGLFLLLYPLGRFALETIRSDNPLDAVGLTVSQLISVGMFVFGMIWMVIIYKMLPERSPRVVPWMPPGAQSEPSPA